LIGSRLLAVRRFSGMALFRYLLPDVCAGGVGGVVAAAGLIATNAPLRGLLFGVEGGWLGIGLLVFGCIATFAPAAAGLAVMRIGRK
jgi:hypothetical protein